MICGGCNRDNDPRRRYCGRCGCNLEPVCKSCSFVNEHDDRYCGGCGSLLTAAPAGDAPVARRLVVMPPPVVPPPAPVAQLEPPALPPPPALRSFELADELGGLFGNPVVEAEAPALPDAGIAQDDLDRLFGVGS